MKNLLKSLSLSLGIFFIFVVVLEVILRTTHLFNARISWSEPHALYGWRFTPNAKYWNRPPEGGHSSGNINSHGWRDIEWSLQKGEGVYRVAVVGDSYAEAFQVELSETFLKIAEKILLDRGYKVELMNFGRSGFTTSEEFLVIRDEVLKFFPDLVVLFFYPPNDIRDADKKLSSDQIRPFFLYDKTVSSLNLDTSFIQSSTFKLKKLVNPIKQNSALVSLLIERYQMFLERGRTNSYPYDCEIYGYLSLATSNPNHLYLKAFDTNKILIKEIIKLLRNRSEMLLVVLDSHGWKTEEEECLKSKDYSFNAFYYEDHLKNLALAENIYFLGLQREFRKDWQKNRRELHWGHWNYNGHKFVADILAENLAQMLDQRESKR